MGRKPKSERQPEKPEVSSDGTNQPAVKGNAGGNGPPPSKEESLSDVGRDTFGKRGADSPGVVDSRQTAPLTPGPTDRPKTRKRRSKAELEAARAEETRIQTEAEAARAGELRERTAATVEVFLQGIDPLFEYVLPPPFRPEEKLALTYVWTEYMMEEGTTISPGKAAVLLTGIVVVPRVIGLVVRWVIKRRANVTGSPTAG